LAASPHSKEEINDIDTPLNCRIERRVIVAKGEDQTKRERIAIP